MFACHIFHFKDKKDVSTNQAPPSQLRFLAQVVLPNGTLITTSETQHPDVFWTLRGRRALTHSVNHTRARLCTPLPPAHALACSPTSSNPCKRPIRSDIARTQHTTGRFMCCCYRFGVVVAVCVFPPIHLRTTHLPTCLYNKSQFS